MYFNKDFINGRSVSKRILGLAVIDNATEQPASSLKCFIRNLTIPIWPFEVLVTLISPKRRIGDFIVNTRIEPKGKVPINSILEDMKNVEFNLGIFMILAIGILYCFGLVFLMEKYLGI